MTVLAYVELDSDGKAQLFLKTEDNKFLGDWNDYHQTDAATYAAEVLAALQNYINVVWVALPTKTSPSADWIKALKILDPDTLAAIPANLKPV